MKINNEDIIKAAERIEEEKWKRHAETDKREKIIEEWEKGNGPLSREQLEKTRQIYDNYAENNREFKKEYIGVIITIIRERREKIRKIELEEK